MNKEMGSQDEGEMEKAKGAADPDEEEGYGKPIFEAQDKIAELATSGELAERAGPLANSGSLSVNTDEHPELANDETGDVFVGVVWGKVRRPEKPTEKEGEGPMAMMPMGRKDAITLEIVDLAVVHGSKSMKLGGGGRFAKLKAKLAGKGVTSPGGLAAFLGRKKLGAERFNKLSHGGK